MRPGIVVGAIVILVSVVLVVRVLARTSVAGLVRVSHLKCGKCGAEFDYAWIPGASFTSVRLGKSRLLRCPVCKKWSVFNIYDTTVDPKTHHCGIRVGPS